MKVSVYDELLPPGSCPTVLVICLGEVMWMATSNMYGWVRLLLALSLYDLRLIVLLCHHTTVLCFICLTAANYFK